MISSFFPPDASLMRHRLCEQMKKLQEEFKPTSLFN
jgi:hypothetical protein